MKRLAAALLMVTGVGACGGPSEIDPNAQFRLAISEATIKATNNGTAWDADASAPDVYVSFNVGGVTSSTTTVQDDYVPFWNPVEGPVVTAAVLRGAGVAPVAVSFWDEDLAVDDTITGTFDVVLTDEDIKAGYVTYANVNGLASATFLIIPQ